MIKNCDNCRNQNNSKPMQDCNTFGYPLFADCENWKPKNEQLAEEYINTSTNNDFCEWKYTNSTSYTATISCEKKTMNIKSMRYYTYCPYCGKKIKVVE